MDEQQGNKGEDSDNEGRFLHQANAQQARVHRLERFRSSGDSSLMGQVVHKVCCMCGCDLSHKMRFKDGTGKYWCSHCNDADHQRTRPAPCADCGTEMPHDQLKQIRGEQFCPVCYEKRQEAGPAPQLRHAPVRPVVVEKRSSLPMLALVFATVAVLVAVLVILRMML